MKVQIIRLWENGKQIPRWRLHSTDPVYGDLIIKDGADPLLRRFSRTAVLRDTSTGNDVIPPLVDAAVVYIKGNVMSISGLEHYDLNPTVAQTWFVEVLSL